MADIQTFRCALVGNAAVGKTAFIRSHLTDEFIETYSATHGAEISQLTFNTNRGPVRFNVSNRIEADCAIIMIDLTSRLSYDNSFKWFARVKNACADIPIVLVGSKCDVAERAVMSDDLYMFQEMNIPYYETSAKTRYQIEQPFLKLIQILMRDATIRLC